MPQLFSSIRILVRLSRCLYELRVAWCVAARQVCTTNVKSWETFPCVWMSWQSCVCLNELTVVWIVLQGDGYAPPMSNQQCCNFSQAFVFLWDCPVVVYELRVACCRETGMHHQCQINNAATFLKHSYSCETVPLFVYEMRIICCRETGMHHLRLLHRLGQLAALMFFPCWLLVGLFPPTPSHKKK